MKQQRSNRRQWLKRIGLSLLAITGVLVIILAVHIYDVTHREQLPTKHWQMARIEFAAPLDSPMAMQVQSYFHQHALVKYSHMNTEQGWLVFAFDNRNSDANSIYQSMKTKLPVATTLYNPSANDMAGSCPVIDKSSVTYKLGSFFQRIF